ncbi:MAG: T9SS type A sorting domain-containing protein [bacterium]
MFGLKRKYFLAIVNAIILICIIFLKPVNGQIRPDFLLVTEGRTNLFHIAYDSRERLQATWGSNGVYYGIFDSLGYPIRPTQIITTTNYAIGSPRLAFRNDYLVVVWSEAVFSFNSFIFGQLLTIDGDLLYSNFVVNDSFYDSARGMTDAAFLNDTTFIVVWSGDGPPPGNSVWGQLVTTSLQFIGNNIPLSDHSINYTRHNNSRVLILNEFSDFVVVWRDDHSGSRKVYGRLFFSNGTPKDSSFIISENPQLIDVWFVSADADHYGNFAVVWGGEIDTAIDTVGIIQWRRFQSDGTPLGPSAKVNTEYVSKYASVDIAFDRDGKSVVVWKQRENSFLRVFGQRFLTGGMPLGGNYQISTLPDTTHHNFPSVTLLNGKICTVWRENEASDLWANIIDFNKPPVGIKNRNNNFSQYFRLFQNYPNPFNSMTLIKYILPPGRENKNVELTIYNLRGQKVITLINKRQSMGEYTVRWDGRNSSGNRVPSGIYFARLISGTFAQTRKMVFIR